jgi:hypothetical protein
VQSKYNAWLQAKVHINHDSELTNFALEYHAGQAIVNTPTLQKPQKTLIDDDFHKGIEYKGTR